MPAAAATPKPANTLLTLIKVTRTRRTFFFTHGRFLFVIGWECTPHDTWTLYAKGEEKQQKAVDNKRHSLCVRGVETILIQQMGQMKSWTDQGLFQPTTEWEHNGMNMEWREDLEPGQELPCRNLILVQPHTADLFLRECV